ncbi:hypothetical protein [Echinimonas agarilytica]|uniref:Prephenate dehydrogenase n=1 Tax=Echinimonas agarilytica TaxID=1215918 RepID=A0AA41W457_9GAMM|nr:hypothetical protein [Echinimonas agarilytica]MCM2678422.1 hypothetical protein [Echinimonas agarilytica]
MTTTDKHALAISMLQSELKQLYRKCVDADQKLDALRKDGKAKFAALFDKDSPFEKEARHFVEYLAELAGDIETLEQEKSEQWPHHLKLLLHKIQMMHQLLEQFSTSLKK